MEMLFLVGARVAFESPTKEHAGLIFLTSAMIFFIYVERETEVGNWFGQVSKLAKMFFPIFLLIIYACLLALVDPAKSPNVWSFSLWLLVGFYCFATAYFVFSKTKRLHMNTIIFFLLLPGIVQLLVYGYDVFLAYMHGKVANINQVKDVARVGRKFVSLALVELFFLALITINLFKYRGYSISSLLLLTLSLTAIASLDARAEYFALIVVLIVILSIGPLRKLVNKSLSKLAPNPFRSYVFFGIILTIAITTAVMAGNDRLKVFFISIGSAFNSSYGVIRWADPQYWETVEDKDKFRHVVDSSAYLRMSWMRYGLEKFTTSPMGIGVNQYPLEELLLQDFPELGKKGELYKKSEFHSALVDMAVCMGVPGLLLTGWFFFQILANGFSSLRSSNQESLLVIVSCLILVGCLARLIVDGLNEGWWYYIMVVAGTLVGLAEAMKSLPAKPKSRSA